MKSTLISIVVLFLFWTTNARAQTSPWYLCCESDQTSSTCFSASQSLCPAANSGTAMLEIPITPASGMAGSVTGRPQVITSAPFHGACFFDDVSNLNQGAAHAPTWCLDVQPLNSLQMGGIINLASGTSNYADALIDPALVTSIAGQDALAVESCFLPAQYAELSSPGQEACTDLGGYCCTSWQAALNAGGTRAPDKYMSGLVPVGAIPMATLPACYTYGASWAINAVGTGVEATPNTAMGTCPAGSHNAGLTDPAGNHCCTSGTLHGAGTPAMPPAMIACLALAMLAVGVAAMHKSRKGVSGVKL